MTITYKIYEILLLKHFIDSFIRKVLEKKKKSKESLRKNQKTKKENIKSKLVHI